MDASIFRTRRVGPNGVRIREVPLYTQKPLVFSGNCGKMLLKSCTRSCEFHSKEKELGNNVWIATVEYLPSAAYAKAGLCN